MITREEGEIRTAVIAELHNKGLKYTEIANQLEYSYSSVVYYGSKTSKQRIDRINTIKALRTRHTQLRSKCKIEDIKFDNDFLKFVEKFDRQEGKCYRSGKTMVLHEPRGGCVNVFSVDRVDPNGGYVDRNTIFMTFEENTWKGNMPMHIIKQRDKKFYNKLKNDKYLDIHD